MSRSRTRSLCIANLQEVTREQGRTDAPCSTCPKKTGTEIDGAQSLLFNLDSANCDVVHTLKTFNTAADFMKEKSKVDFCGHTYVIKNCPDLQAALDERHAKSAMGIFRVQYPFSRQAQEYKRGQTPFVATNKSTIRERLLELTPKTDIQYFDDDSKMHTRLLNQISLFAASAGMYYKGFERHAMPNCRYQTAGEREIMVMELNHLSDFAMKIGVNVVPGQDFTTYMDSVVDALLCSGGVKTFKDVGGKLHRGIVSAGQFSHVPLGAMCLERTVGSTEVYGMRTMCLPPTDSAVYSSFCKMVEQAKVAAPDAQLTKFWTAVREEYHKVK